MILYKYYKYSTIYNKYLSNNVYMHMTVNILMKVSPETSINNKC
jgi:hypothetical protein